MVDLKFKLKFLWGSLVLLTILSTSTLAANRPPQLSPIGSKEILVGETLSFSLSAIDPDQDQIIFAGSGLPANSFLNPKTGLFSWTPEINQLGTYLFTFTARDNGSPRLSASETVPVRVVYRLAQQQKAWGLGLKETETIAETSSITDLYPKIKKIEIDGRAFSPSQTVFYTSENPKIKIQATSPYHIDKDAISVLLDGEKTEISPFSDVQTFGEEKKILSLTFMLSPKDLSLGKHILNLEIGNELGFSAQSLTLDVGKLRIVDKPLVFPVPFTPSPGKELNLQYSLSKNAEIEIYIVSSSGEIVKRLSASEGEEGGKEGLNKVGWDGKSEWGNYVGNGIYIATIISKADRDVLGKIKLVIY
ncbi:hypothetical protein AMJ44_06795 [candidate division WOR-1 bacterium DG_54_3]|uniref:FlgD Ig-like domain-containing protein n=1 Tax=candidate division WOR-1 bacterium DG_54_3 TaxID=1703775 RepID=A0A0S7Y0R2_UNCSA|nr:MAG: hypothetical protein AMJ44_06795 [candidate division WOR-1 bacterium DG_54_3]